MRSIRVPLFVVLIVLLLAGFSAAQCSPSGVAGTVNICAPAAGSTVSSPVSFQAAATPISGRTVTAMRLYVDSVSEYTVSANTLSTSVTLATGTHNVAINAWDNTGAVYQAKESITVGATTTDAPFGNFDTGSVSGTSLFAAGWAADKVDGAPVTRVVMLVDNAAVGNATLGYSRPDVASAFNNPAYTNSGWQFTMDTASLANGNHNLTARAYNAAGASTLLSGSFAFSTSGGTCSPTAGVVTICAPSAGATVASPVTFQAVAGAPSGQTITSMRLYVDSVSEFTVSGASLNTSVSLANGTHNVVVNSWTNTGAVIQAKESITVGTSTGGVSVSISPTSATLAPSATQQFTASVSGSTNTAVNWSVDGVVGGSASGGTITSTGLYTAPSTAGSHTVTATSQADTTKSADATVTVQTTSSCSPTAGVVTICAPASGATVTSPVTFQAVAGAPSGQTIKSMKLYIDSVSQFSATGASLNTSLTLAAGTHKVTVNAWTSSGTVEKGTETITVSTNTTPSVTVSPSSATIVVSQTKQFTATVTNLSSTAVTWSVDGTAGGTSTTGTISTTGLYTAPAAAGTHTITATSNADATRSGSATANVVTSPPPPPPSGPAVYTYMNSNLRSGLNSSETTLTPTNVASSSFIKRGTWTLDASSYTQALFVPNVSVGSGTFNVLYIATENDSVYALDADHPGTVLWKRNLIPSGASIGKSYSCSGTTCDGRSSDLGANIGITGTPVIDPNTGWLYVAAKTTENTVQVYRLHALDIRNGNDAIPSVVLHGSVPGTGGGSSNGTLSFDALVQNQREGLLLDNGIVYIPFGSYGDDPPYHGWILAYSASNLGYLAAYADTPDTDGGGIWSSGAAPAADSNGNIYFATSNQLPYASGFPNIPTEIPNSVVKLKLVGSTLSLVDYFVPYNTQCLTNDDLDLGSSAPMLIPDSFAGLNMMAIGSKEGRVYLINRDNLGKFHSGSDSQILSSQLFNPQGPCGPSPFNASTPWRVYGAPAYWNGNIYFGSAFGPLRQYNITAATLKQVALGSHTYAANGQVGRGPLTSVSSNGTSNAIVWTLENDLSNLGWLRAYDATNVSKQLFVSNFGTGANFVIPTVTHGHVYFPAKNVVYSYGVN